MSESLKCDMGCMSHTSDEFMMGSYPEDTCSSSEASNKSAECGNIATATEYNSDATKAVDYTTDTGFEGGVVGGETAVVGMLYEAVCRKCSHMGEPSKKSGSQLSCQVARY